MATNKSVLTDDNLIGKTGRFEEIFSNIDMLEKRLINLAKSTKNQIDLINPNDSKKIQEAEQKLKQLEKAQRDLNKQKQSATKQQKKLNELTQEELIIREQQKLENRERVQRAKQLAILRTNERKSIAGLRAQLSLVTLDWKKLTEAQRNDSKEGRRLIANKKALTEQLKRLEKATGDNRREVGNYSIATSKLGKTLRRVFVGRDIASAIIRIGAALGDVIENNRDTSEGIGRIASSLDTLKNGAEDATVSLLEFVATPVSNFFDNISFSIAKIREFFTGLSNDTSTFGTVVSKVFSVITKPIRRLFFIIQNFPAIIGGVINVFREFGRIGETTFNNIALRAEQAFLEVKKGLLSITGSDVSELERELDRVNDALIRNREEGISLSQAYEEGFRAVKEEQAAFNAEQAQRLKDQEAEEKAVKAKTEAIKKQNQLLKEQAALQKEVSKSNTDRLTAINELQERLTKAQIENEEDKQKRLLELEDLAFKEQQKQREQNFDTFVTNIEKQENLIIQIYGEGSKEVIAFREQAGKDLLNVEALNQKLQQEQLEASEKKKLEIRKDFAIKTIDLETISVLSATNEEEKKLLDEKVEQIDVANEQIKDSNDKLFKDIVQSSQKVADVISDVFKKRSEIAEQAIERQTAAIETQQQRAEQGLDNTLKFEQEELARRQSELIASQKRERDAAEILALYNLVAAYAQNGDENALQRALVDIAALKAATGLIGFYDGTENVGDALGDNKAFNTGKDDYLGVTKSGKAFRFDGNERIVNPIQNKALGGMSNEDLVANALLGASITDTNMMISANHFRQQSNDMTKSKKPTDNTRPLIDEIREVKKILKKTIKSDYDIEKATDTSILIAKKVTANNMTRIEKIKKAL